MFIRMKWRLSRVCCFGENADANLARCRCRDATDVLKSTSSTESESEDDLGPHFAEMSWFTPERKRGCPLEEVEMVVKMG